MSERKKICFRSGFELVQLYKKKNLPELLIFELGKMKKQPQVEKKILLKFTLMTDDVVQPFYRSTDKVIDLRVEKYEILFTSCKSGR